MCNLHVLGIPKHVSAGRMLLRARTQHLVANVFREAMRPFRASVNSRSEGVPFETNCIIGGPMRGAGYPAIPIHADGQVSGHER